MTRDQKIVDDFCTLMRVDHPGVTFIVMVDDGTGRTTGMGGETMRIQAGVTNIIRTVFKQMEKLEESAPPVEEMPQRHP